MNYARVWRTVRRLRATQVWYQVWYRLHRPGLREWRGVVREAAGPRVEPCAKPRGRFGREFEFLNIRDTPTGWNDTRHGMLWAYNLNYMDWLSEQAEVEAFVDDLAGNRVGLDPYPIALRTINWAKLGGLSPRALRSLRAQVDLLERKLEKHLLGNHLLEDLYALYIAGAFFGDDALLRRAEKALKRQLREQVLPDGAHYEQSPMYHSIMLDRLLDCINFRPDAELEATAARMLGHLEAILWEDGTIPLLNDSARGIAPEPAEIFAYAKRLGLEWTPIAPGACGYRKMAEGEMEAIVDIGNITATYQPGHTHADTFNYELRLSGRPFVVDTGISTYDKTPRRQYERSTAAHNTATPLDGGDSSEVWGGFRVGRRARVTVHEDRPGLIRASHDGFRGLRHERTFAMSPEGFRITDRIGAPGVSRIHLAPGVEVLAASPTEVRTSAGTVAISGATRVDIVPARVSTTYNRFEDSQTVEIHFDGETEYIIKQ